MLPIDIFYADDDEDDLMFFNEAIEKITTESENQVILHTHLNGENLIESIKENKERNAIVFLDINMPFKSGLELLEEIRKDTDIEKFPVVMYSTSSNLDNIQQCLKLGADFYVIKPSRFTDVVEMISKFIQINWDNHQTDSNNFIYKV